MSAPSKEEPSNLKESIAYSRAVVSKGLPLVHGERQAEIYGAAVTIVALADENDRLRKTWHIKRCDKWSEEDPARRCRLAIDHETDCDFGELERLRAENERLRAERAECLELLEEPERNCCHVGVMFGECHFSPEPCWEHRRRTLVAKLRGQQP